MGNIRDGDEEMIPAIVAMGVVVAGMTMTTSYVALVTYKRNRQNLEELDFKCPECGASVDASVMVCPECSAEFKEDEFECPVCSSLVSADMKLCMHCGEKFDEEETFECPHCGTQIPPDTIVCAKCDEEFWSPIRPPVYAEVETFTETEQTEEISEEVPSS
jgi:DNA-directed RNA polymerase subunit RPC12/RpoP